MRRTIWHLSLAGTLLVLLAVLGTLQYRWLAEVSNAERERLRASLRTRAGELAADFDREIARTYDSFHIEPTAYGGDPAGALSDALNKARSTASTGALVKAVFVAESDGGAPMQLRQLDPMNRRLLPVPWPPELEKLRATPRATVPTPPGGLPTVLVGQAIVPDIPALVVPQPTLRYFEGGGRLPMLPDALDSARAVIVWLDGDWLTREFLPSLVRRHFSGPDASEYFVNVVKRSDPSVVLYALGGADDVRPETADVTAGLFALRDQLSRFSVRVPAPPPGRPGGRTGAGDVQNQVAITVVRKAAAAERVRVLIAANEGDGAWQLLIRCRSGSLEALVAASRRRNLAIGLGVLGLLAVSFVFVVASAQRQQKLARQQMEFVAAVSHELRTPLAVIRSAGENLADGVVVDGEQIRRYGALIRSEGHRLTDMVERVLEFAGIANGVRARPAGEVRLEGVLDEAVALVGREASDRGIRIARSAEGPSPVVRGDAVALRSALQNVLGNAIKYSPPDALVEIQTSCDDRSVRVTIRDRGLGIDRTDLPHVFKPFFRGRRAVDAQIPGTGVGLSVVRHVMDAHGGEARVESSVGSGTTVTLVLPAGTEPRTIVAEPRTAT
jgi:signal transduction histidine kinase